VTKLAAVIAASVLGLNTYVFYFMGANETLPPRRSFDAFPRELNGWTCPERLSMEDKIEQRLGVSDYWLCDYVNPEERRIVGVYLGYHQRQVREGAKSAAESSIHPPAHCLPGSGWDIIHSEVAPLDLPGIPPSEVNRLIVAKGDARQLVYYWYQERGRVIASDYLKIVYLFWDRATRSRSDGALVRFTVPIGRDGEERADAAFRSLATEMVPLIPDFIPG
jgi:EpsI family protein